MKARVQYFFKGAFGETLFSAYETDVYTKKEVSELIRKAFKVDGTVFFETHPEEVMCETVVAREFSGDKIRVWRAGGGNASVEEKVTRQTAINRVVKEM